MARYWRQDITGLGAPATPPVGPLGGLQPLSRARWESPMRGQDRVGVTSRRVVMQIGAGADTGWRFVSGAPDPDTQVAYGVSLSQLTSGCLLRGSVLYLPSGGVGLSPAEIAAGNPPEEGGGTLRLIVTWTADDATTETHTVNVDLPVSVEEEFEVATGNGAAWGELRSLQFALRPPVDFADDAEANRWTVSPTVEIDAYQVGGSRIVDFCLYEEPVQICMESDDTDWTSHVFGVGDVDASTQAASVRPRTRRSETTPDGNPRGGTRHTMDVAREQRERFGPMLCAWGNYQEATGDEDTGLVGLSRVGSASSMVGLFDVTQTAYDADREGLSVSCGGYARDWRGNSAGLLGTEDAEAVIPVAFRVYGEVTGVSGTARIRLHTSDHSWVEVELTTTVGWHDGWGQLKVGINPSDPIVAQVFVDGDETVEVYGFTLQRLA